MIEETWASPAARTEAFTEDLRRLLNRYSAEQASGTPDFILAEYLVAALRAYNVAVQDRGDWRRDPVPLDRITPTPSEDA